MRWDSAWQGPWLLLHRLRSKCVFVSRTFTLCSTTKSLFAQCIPLVFLTQCSELVGNQSGYPLLFLRLLATSDSKTLVLLTNPFLLSLPTFFAFDQYHEKANPVRQLQRNLVERSGSFLF